MLSSCIYLCLSLMTFFNGVIGGNFLTEKPDVLNPCMLEDIYFNECFAENVQVIFHEWKDGVPGFQSVDSLDPFLVRRVIIPQDPNNPVSLDIDMHNVMVGGVSGSIVRDASFDPYSVIAKFNLLIPKLGVISDYTVKGRILNIPLNGNGNSYINIDNSEIHVVIHFKLRNDGKFTFLDVDKLRLEVREVSGLRIRLDNLFHGQTILEESINAVFNQHWHDFYDILQPSIRLALETTMHHRFSTVFAQVPATYFIKDVNNRGKNF